jgi:hypothetical protein
MPPDWKISDVNMIESVSSLKRKREDYINSIYRVIQSTNTMPKEVVGEISWRWKYK